MTKTIYLTNSVVVEQIGDLYRATVAIGGRIEHYGPMTAADAQGKFPIPETVLKSGQ